MDSVDRQSLRADHEPERADRADVRGHAARRYSGFAAAAVAIGHFAIYQKAVPLSPGLYRLDIVLKDVNSGNVGVVNTRLAVPRFQDDQLSSSSLILADEIQRVSTKDIGLGQFVLGDVKVRPKLDQTFTPSDNMGVFLQVYNLKVDDKTHKADASVEYRVTKDREEHRSPRAEVQPLLRTSSPSMARS